jgi:hypothetical protein
VSNTETADVSVQNFEHAVADAATKLEERKDDLHRWWTALTQAGGQA